MDGKMWILRFTLSGRQHLAPIAQPVVRLGRADGNDIVLRAVGVSRAHCEFSLRGKDGAELWVKDLGSSSGIWRGDLKLEEARLDEGDCLRVGSAWLVVQGEASSDWKPKRGGKVSYPIRIGEGSDGSGDTVNPEREWIPLDSFLACMEALADSAHWGSRWGSILGLGFLEILSESEQGSLCLWPGKRASEPGDEEVVFDRPSGPLRARFYPAPKEARATLQALLPALALTRAPRPERRLGAGGPVAAGSVKGGGEAWEPPQSLAASDLPILIFGETGAGKEVMARAIHEAAFPHGAPFEVIHCAAIPEALLESELFGIEANTATGVDGKKGKLEAANGGTVLLDEIGEIPLSVQSKLLRVLEERAVLSVGGRRVRPLKVRWLSATNKDLAKAIRDGQFREDLIYRLRGAEVRIPPLRERPEAFPALVNGFLEEMERETPKGLLGLSEGAYRALMGHSWPGNVRELKMEIKRAFLLAEPGGMIQMRHLSPHFGSKEAPQGEGDPHHLAHRRREAAGKGIREALAATGGNVTRAAGRLGVTRQTLTKLMREMGIRRKE
jgi:DNA-binding NtrC family response regulator